MRTLNIGFDGPLAMIVDLEIRYLAGAT